MNPVIDVNLYYRLKMEDLTAERANDPKFNESVINLINSLKGLYLSDEFRLKMVPVLHVMRDIRRERLEDKHLTEKERDNLCGEIGLIKFIIDEANQIVQSVE